MNDTPNRILVVDDEPSITEFVSYALKKEGFYTDVVDNGEEALALATQEPLRPVRARHHAARHGRLRAVPPPALQDHGARAVPVGARHRARQGGRAWRSAGTTTWPSPSACASSSPACARCCAAAPAATSPARTTPSRPAASRSTRTPTRRRASRARSTSRRASSSCLASLMKNAGKVVSREDLLRDAWGWEYLTETKTVDTHIKRLRDKIEACRVRPRLGGDGSRIRVQVQTIKRLQTYFSLAGNAAHALLAGAGRPARLLHRLRHPAEGVSASRARRGRQRSRSASSSATSWPSR